MRVYAGDTDDELLDELSQLGAVVLHSMRVLPNMAMC